MSSNLLQYVITHTQRGECTCGKCIDRGNTPDPEHAVDMEFFKVALFGNPTAAELLRLVAEHSGEFASVNPFDGQEHSYIELGAWLGDQGLALQFMALSELLGVAQVQTPSKMLPGFPPDLLKNLAGAGYVTLQAKGTTDGTV